jgi:MYXO-CTERM domain-containing protein
MDFLLAAGGSSVRDDGSGFTWGDLNPINNGASLSMFGGVEPSPISECVPLAELVRPTGLKIPNELLDDQLINDWPAATPGPHIGIGLSEAFFNYAMAGLYNSGLFCIGISTETVDLLNSGTLGLLAQSLKDLGIQQETQPVALMIRPTQPPHVTFGNGTNIETDPLIRLELPQASFDFYMFSSDRYVRFMTATFDLDVPLNLTVTPEGLVPVLETIGIANGKVENSELIKEDPAGLAATLQGLLSSQIGSLLGDGLPAVDLNGALASLGMRLVIPESVEGQGSPGLRTLTKDGERYLGIFAALEVADAGMMNANAAETEADISSVEVDAAGLRAGTITADNAPVITVEVAARSPEGEELEHQIRIDGSLWRPWSRKGTLQVTSEALRVEGKHLIEVRSRVVGEPYSVDPSPEQFEVIIDTLAPQGRVSTLTAGGEVNLTVRDMVSKEATLVRYRFDDGAFGAWVPAVDLPSIAVPETAELIEVEMKDEAGNVGTARQEIIRGLPRGDGSGGCGCVVVGAEPTSRGWQLGALGLAMLGALFARRRRARAAEAPAKPRVGGLGAAITRSKSRQAAAAAVVLGVAGSYSGCSCDEETTPPDPDYECIAPGCSTLEQGLIGSYTSAAVDGEGNVWVAGYLEAAYEQAWPKYGDLVVGRVGEDDKVAWEIVDGVPTDPPPDGKVTNLEGFRGGQTEPGDDVGIWTSLAINPATGFPAVSYYDRTNDALKFAEFNGTAWTIETVRDEPEGDVGKYSKLVYDGNTPVIAYMFMEPSDSGNIASGVKLARKATGGFQIEEVVRNEATPCRFGLCTGGAQCLADEGTCSTTASGCAECAAGEECMQTAGGPACAVVLTSVKVEPYPVASGLYVALAKVPGGGLGVAYYDRVNGTVNVAAQAGEGWTNVVVDGGVLPSGVVSDVGVGASLFIDDGGAWHVSYVDGYNEALKYARVADGVVEVIELVDEGFGVDGIPHPDGQHVIGDDSSISVTPSGSVQITYQDATNGTVRFATGAPNASGGNDWSVRVLESEVFGGFFSRQIEIAGSMKVLHWGRQIITAEDGLKKGVGDVSVISP